MRLYPWQGSRVGRGGQLGGVQGGLGGHGPLRGDGVQLREDVARERGSGLSVEVPLGEDALRQHRLLRPVRDRGNRHRLGHIELNGV